jgi:hypothetical protein
MTMRLSTGLRNAVLNGGSGNGIKASFAGGFINIYSGSQPAAADNAATGTLLGTVTVGGDGATGINFDAAAGGVLSKAAAESWEFVGLAAGIAGWFRLYVSGDGMGSSTTAKRLDGAIGTSGAELNLSNLNIVVDQVNTCDSFTVTMPAQ